MVQNYIKKLNAETQAPINFWIVKRNTKNVTFNSFCQMHFKISSKYKVDIHVMFKISIVYNIPAKQRIRIACQQTDVFM